MTQADDELAALRDRQQVRRALVHALQGDSWGLQDALTKSDDTGFVDGFLSLWPTLWEAGHLLRHALNDDERERLIDALRRDLAEMTGILESE